MARYKLTIILFSIVLIIGGGVAYLNFKDSVSTTTEKPVVTQTAPEPTTDGKLYVVDTADGATFVGRINKYAADKWQLYRAYYVDSKTNEVVDYRTYAFNEYKAAHPDEAITPIRDTLYFDPTQAKGIQLLDESTELYKFIEKQEMPQQ